MDKGAIGILALGWIIVIIWIVGMSNVTNLLPMNVNGTIVVHYNNTIIHVNNASTIVARMIYNIPRYSIGGLLLITAGVILIVVACSILYTGKKSLFTVSVILFGIGNVVSGTGLSLVIYTNAGIVVMMVGLIISIISVVFAMLYLIKKAMMIREALRRKVEHISS